MSIVYTGAMPRPVMHYEEGVLIEPGTPEYDFVHMKMERLIAGIHALSETIPTRAKGTPPRSAPKAV